MNSNQKGAIAEAAIAAAATKLGIGVLRPLADERYDLIFDLRPNLLRVQCKSCRRQGEVLDVHVGGSWYSPRRGYVRSTYGKDEVDAVAVYSPDMDRCYLLPATVFAGSGRINLRLSPTRNGQTASVNWAADYEFGAVAQLEERLRGTQEVVGSSPTSSIHRPSKIEERAGIQLAYPNPTDSLVRKETVGMDQFHSRLAHHVRNAETGGEVLVTRWGRPVAKLVQADQQEVLGSHTRAL